MLLKTMKNKIQVKPSRRILKDTLLLKLKDFCQHSSLHGVNYFYTSSSTWIHVSWAVIVVLSVCLCGYLSHMIWQKYALNPTFTIVETTQWPTEKVPFPALSVCDPQIIYAPNAKNISNILRLRGYNDTAVDQFYRSFSNIKKADYVPPDYIKKMHSTLEDLGYNYNYLINELRSPCDVLLRRCEWRSKQFDCGTMFRDVFSVAGHCCQFDLQYFRQAAGRDVKFTAGIEITEALDIQVNVVGDGASDGLVFMYIFDSENELTLLDSSITLSAATFFDVTIDVWVIDSSDDVTALSLRDRQCFLDTEGSSYQSCMMHYIMKIVVAECKCLPFNYTVPELPTESLPSCNWQKLKCVYDTLDKTLSDMRHVISALHCYQKCDYTQYETETELVKRERNIKKEDESYCRVTVHFGDTTCIKYRREVLYSWDQMLANLGGIFGLCLGGSLVSVIEVVWLLTELVYTAITYRKEDESYCRVTVHFGDTTCIKYRREVLYSWDQMLANLGGIFGLCLGGSLVSVIEVVWLLTELVYTAITYRKVSKNVFALKMEKIKPYNADRNLPYID